MSTAEKLINQGLEKGIEQGIEQEKKEIARNMLKKKTNKQYISEVTGLTIEQIDLIKKTLTE